MVCIGFTKKNDTRRPRAGTLASAAALFFLGSHFLHGFFNLFSGLFDGITRLIRCVFGLIFQLFHFSAHGAILGTASAACVGFTFYISATCAFRSASATA